MPCVISGREENEKPGTERKKGKRRKEKEIKENEKMRCKEMGQKVGRE